MNPDICIFCKAHGPFNTVEHIVPESLGNDTDILKGMVCDNCQKYLGTNVEKPALEKTPIAFWRTYLGIRSKKGKHPSINLTPIEKGVLPSGDSETDNIGFSAHPDGTTSVDIDDSLMIQKIISKDRNSFKLVLSPLHVSIIGRFLGKMGLEYIAKSDYTLSLQPQFDEIRSYVRNGSTNFLWPIYWGQYGAITDLKGQIVKNGKNFEQDIQCYSLSLGVTKEQKYIFVFLIGTDMMLLCLSNRIPKKSFSNSIQNTKLNCIWYPDNSWKNKK